MMPGFLAVLTYMAVAVTMIRAVVFVELAGAVWTFELMAFAGNSGKTRHDSQQGKKFHRREHAPPAGPLATPDQRNQNGQMSGMSRQETTAAMMLSGMPIFRKSVNR